MPRMPLSGVLISWLMLARNCDLARFADSAASLATCRRWISVMSEPEERVPACSPSGPGSEVVCQAMIRSEPLRVSTRCSKYSLARSPARWRRTSSRSLAGTNSSSQLRPRSSFSE